MQNTYSFDLIFTIDKWPLSVIYTYVKLLFGILTVLAIANGIKGLNTFFVGNPIVASMYEVTFLARQSLGYYGSCTFLYVTPLFGMVGSANHGAR